MIPLLGLFSNAKLIMAGVIAIAVAGAFLYIKNLQATVETLKANQIQLEGAVELQTVVIERQKEDNEQITMSLKSIQNINSKLQGEMEALQNRFKRSTATGKSRNFGAIARKKSKLVENIVNKATINSLRCLEIATNSPLTKEELNASKKSTINSECPSIANPGYNP